MKLQRLELDGFDYFDDMGLSILSESLQFDSALRSLSIYNSRHDCIYSTINKVLSESKLTELNLGHFRYNNEATKLVCNSFKYVEKVTLNNIAMERDSLKGCFADSKVKWLNINQSNLDDKDAIQIAEELPKSQLKSLVLNCNNINRKGYNALLSSQMNVFNETIKFNFPVDGLMAHGCVLM
jgi:hypothetical protein